MFSIVMPVWNKRPYLTHAVAGVLAQSRPGFELIAVDDGSTDGSLDLLRGFSDPRIRIIVQANAGPGGARNTGIEAARHNWIAFLDADDLWLPDHLAELDRVRARHPGAGLIGTGFVSCRRDGAFATPLSDRTRVAEIDYFDAGAPFFTSSAAIPAQTYRSLGGFGDAVPGQDSEYWARVALQRPVAVSSRVTAVYRRGTGGISEAPESPWKGKAILSAADIEPSTALLVARYGEVSCPRRRRAIHRYIDGKLRWCVRRAARTGDVPTLRALPGLFRRPPPLSDRLILGLARLPAPVARAAYRVGREWKRFGLRFARGPGD